MTGSSYIELPKSIKNREAIVNVKNYHDQKCFFYAIATRAIEHHKNKERVTRYTDEILTQFNFTGLDPDGPINLRQISVFEKNNNASVNVYGLNEDKKVPEIYPLRICREFKPEKHWDLLYLSNERTSHYCYIKNLSALIRSQKTLHKTKCHICRCCLQSFHSKEKLESHTEHCYRFKPLRVHMPRKNRDDFLVFAKEKLKLCQMLDYVIYADFECILNDHTYAPLNENQSTYATHLHQPSSFCYYIVSRNSADHTNYQPILYRGENAVKIFWQRIESEMKKIGKIMANKKDMNITSEERERETHENSISQMPYM